MSSTTPIISDHYRDDVDDDLSSGPSRAGSPQKEQEVDDSNHVDDDLSLIHI